jgi:dienelactone hydrolase
LVGAVNFAGGGGGNPTDRQANPCSSHLLASLYKDYGATSKVPSLWLYSENDRFWGSALPKEWFDSFVQAEGKAEFVQLPPYKEDGHGIFIGNRNAWKSAFESFLHKLGFPIAANAQAGSPPNAAR